MVGISRRAERARRGYALVLLVFVLGLSGCRVPHGPDPSLARVTVTPSPSPPAMGGADRRLPTVNTARVERVLVPAERGALSSPFERGLAAAREAFWNRDTDQAVAGFRALLEQPEAQAGRHRGYLQALLVECYQADGRWTEALEQMRGMGWTEGGRRRKAVAFAEFMAKLPPPRVTFESVVRPVAFERRLGQLVMARVRINGVEARAFVDTGFSRSYVTEEFARRAGVDVRSTSVPLHDANGSTGQAQMAVVREWEIGGLRAANWPVVCGPARRLGSMLGPVDAVLGWDLLQLADVTWDFPAGVMTLVAPVRNAAAPDGSGGGGADATAPRLAGRRAPIVTVMTEDGGELDLFLDTGFAARPAGVALVRNAGLLFTKVDERRVRARWRPTFQLAMNSFRVRWPSIIRPFRFWSDGHWFGLTQATVSRSIDVREGLVTCDGVIGNAPFLQGQLRLCAVERRFEYRPSTSADPRRPDARP